MARVFDIDVLECPRCKSRMQVISFVKDPKAIFDILRSLKMSTTPPQIHESEGCFIEYEIEAIDDHLEEEVPTIVY